MHYLVRFLMEHVHMRVKLVYSCFYIRVKPKPPNYTALYSLVNLKFLERDLGKQLQTG
jgi:hypothetical protein